MGKKQTAYVNPAMLVWARNQTPYSSCEEVATNIAKISADELRAWEEGEDAPSITKAEELARLYKVPFACFYLSDPPTETIVRYKDRRTPVGTEYDTVSKPLWRGLERAVSQRDIIIELDGTMPQHGLPDFTHADSPEEIGEQLRAYVGAPPSFKFKSEYGNDSFTYFRRRLENRGILVTQIPEVSTREMQGLSIYYDTCPIIAINSKDYPRAKTFSLFHELAHLARRSSSLCTMDFDERNDEEEKLCDRIAACALMPSGPFKEIAGKWREQCGAWSVHGLSEIGDKFGTSDAAVLRRLRELGLINEQVYHDLYSELTAEFELRAGRNRPKKKAPIPYSTTYLSQCGHLFPRSVLSAYADGEMSYGEVCQMLDIQRKYVPEIERRVMV